eukprot:1672963-Prymnesium_polylepis.1
MHEQRRIVSSGVSTTCAILVRQLVRQLVQQPVQVQWQVQRQTFASTLPQRSRSRGSEDANARREARVATH